MGKDQPECGAEETLSDHLLIRADASTQIGSGHVMRCLALAQAWQDNGSKVTFVAQDTLPSGLQKRLHDEGMAIRLISTTPGSAEDAQQTIAIAQELAAHTIVIDGYVFGADYQKQIKSAGFKLLFIDDNGHADHYYADFVLNQNIHADKKLYKNRESYTKLLLGTKYALLRREFWKYRDWQREIPDVARKILVTMGGSDPDNITLKVLHALEQVSINNLEVKVVVGGSNPHNDTLQVAAQQSPHSVRLERNITNMPELMAWADIAVSAGGSTCWELSFMGLPDIILVSAENQQYIASELDKYGCVSNFGWYSDTKTADIEKCAQNLLIDMELYQKMSQLGQMLVDGKGGSRVADDLRDR